MRNLVAFDCRLSRNQVKEICGRYGLNINDLDNTGKIEISPGRYLMVRHYARGRGYWYADLNRDHGLLDVIHMPTEAQGPAIGQMCDQMNMSRVEVQALLDETREAQADQAVLHALKVG